jgi:2-dehydropantoate 2-reductase
VRQVVVPAVVYVATAMPEPGLVTHHGRGDLVVGALDTKAAPTPRCRRGCRRWSTFFADAQVPVRISADVMAELWSKLMVNCAVQRDLGDRAGELRQAHRACRGAVAAGDRSFASRRPRRRRGRRPPLEPALEAMRRIAPAMPGAALVDGAGHGTRQAERDRPPNGFVARRGAALGVATPANQALHALVRLIESGRGQA